MKNIFDNEYNNFIRYIIENYINKNAYHFYIFISRKCFYYTKVIARKKGYEDILEDKIRDRDVLKEICLDELKGKRILLIDDTFHSGKTLEDVLTCMGKGEDRPKVDIAVFCLSARGLSNMMGHDMFMECGRFYWKLYPEEMMSHMSLHELQTIHAEMMPYVIDLPVFEKDYLSYPSFELMTEESRFGWEFHEYTVELYDRSYQNGFFIYRNGYIGDKLGECLHSMVVKCRYRIEENDGGLIVVCRFVPFVMLRTITYRKLEELFINLFADTEYLEIMKRDNSENGNRKKYIALYRAVVYVLSYLVGKMFQQYVRCWTDQNIELSYNLSQWTPNENLKRSVEKIFSEFSVDGFNRRLLSVSEEDSGANSGLFLQRQGENADSKEIFDYLMGEVALVERKSHAFISQREIEENLLEQFCFKNREDYKCELTKVLLKMLDSGCLSNSLWQEGEKIIRGFKTGEAAHFLVGHRMKIFYAGIFAFYNFLYLSVDMYRKKYNLFLNHFHQFLHQKLYFDDGLISENEFDYLSVYFSMEDLNNEILQKELENKRFLLKKNLMEEELYIRKIFEFVFSLDSLRGE